MIRDAKFADIQAITIFLQEAYARSHYARRKEVGVDLEETKRLLVASIQRHGHSTLGACFVQVSESGGRIDGLMLGTLARVYVIGDKLMATDVFWIVGPKAAPGDAMILMRNMVKWAQKSIDVVEIKCGATAVIGDPAIAGRMLGAMGFTEYGGIYRKEMSECLASSAA